MKILINNVLYDDRHTPFALIMADDEERKELGSHITNMPDKSGPRVYYRSDTASDGLLESEFRKVMERLLELGVITQEAFNERFAIADDSPL